MSDIPGTDNIDNDVDFEKLGFTVAGTVSTKISPKTRLQMEIRFFQRGAQQSPTLVNDSASSATINPSGQYYTPYFTLRLNYIDVVVGIKMLYILIYVIKLPIDMELKRGILGNFGGLLL